MWSVVNNALPRRGRRNFAGRNGARIQKRSQRIAHALAQLELDIAKRNEYETRRTLREQRHSNGAFSSDARSHVVLTALVS